MRTTLVYPTLAMLAVLTTAALSSHSVSVLAPAAAPDIGVPATYIGAFVSITYASAMLSGTVTGTFVARFGAVRVCQATVLSAGLAMLLLAFASIPTTILSAMLLGLAHGPFNPASAHILIKVSSPEWRPLIFSIKQTGVPLGALLAGALTPTLALLAGWRGALLAIALLALGVLALLQPMRRGFDADRDPRKPLAGISVAAPLRLVLAHRGLRPLALSAFAYAGCQLSVGAFFVVYLAEAIGMPLVRAGLIFALMQAAGICGRVLWGAIAGRLVSGGHLLMALGWVMATAVVAVSAVTPAWSAALIGLVAVVLGASSLGWNGVSLAEIAARSPEGQIIEATGGVQFIMFAGIVVVPASFGAIVRWTGSYDIAFLAIAGLAAGAALYLARSRAGTGGPQGSAATWRR